MTATRDERRFMIVALVLSLVAIAVMVGDKISNPDIANRQTFDLLQLIFSSLALVFGIAVVVRARRHPKQDTQVIDLRERLTGLVDLDDVATDEAMQPRL